MSRNKKLIREHFAVETEYDIKDIEYAIVDEPYLGYEIHLNKLSCGQHQLFQRHKTIKIFKELEEFCLKNKSVISIYQELSHKFNNIVNPDTGKYFRTIALNGDATEQERQNAFERLAMDENEEILIRIRQTIYFLQKHSRMAGNFREEKQRQERHHRKH